MVSLLPGSQLGRYQIAELIGRGGMASVFKAYDSQLDRDVAIKVLPSFDTEDPTFVDRFRQEAQAVAKLKHPNIIQVHDLGEDKGFHYIVMEYVTGGTLIDRMRSRLSVTEALDLLSPLADALDSAHGQGVVHRDIKPGNVLLDEDGKPILSDFGLARMLESSAALTRPDSVLGTPEYISPEQALGRPADHRSDLYALGIMLYQMLLGRTPFRGETPTETLMAHIHQPVPMPSDLDATIDRRVQSALAKALAKDPDDRYQSANALVEALAVASARVEVPADLEMEPTPEAPALEPTIEADRLQPAGRRRTLVIASSVGIAAVALVAAVGLLIISGDNSEDGDQPGQEAATGAASPPVASQVPPAAPGGVPPVPAAPAVQGEGTAVVFDDQRLSDAVAFRMDGVSAVAPGKVYVGWLVSDDGSLKFSTGSMTVRPDGILEHTFDSNSKGYTGANLIDIYSKIVITVEEAGAKKFDAPAGVPAFSDEVPLGAMEHIRHLLTNWPSGASKGILTNLNEQLEVALFHAKLADGSQTLDGVRQHAEHVVNILEGSQGPNYGDLDGNGAAEDPGDGVGALTHAADRKHGAFASSQAPDDRQVTGHAELVLSHAERAEQLASLARDVALQVLDAADVPGAKKLLGPGENTVIGLIDAALNGQGDPAQGGAAQAYVEAQLMAAHTLKPIAQSAAMVPAAGGHIAYGLSDGRVYRVEAREGATPEDISLRLDSLSAGSPDEMLNISPNGEWLLVSSGRLDPKCDGRPCLALIGTDISAAEPVRSGDGQLVHQAQGLSAVASSGNLVVYQQEGVVGRHVTDLFAIVFGGGPGSAPVILTGESPYVWHENPSISDDGTTVLFQCGNESRSGHAICETGVDGAGFRVVLSPADSPSGAPDTGTLHNPDYAPDGSIVFSADWDGDGIWRLPARASQPIPVLGEHSQPCVLPDGRVAAVYEDRSGGGSEPDIQIRLLAADGSGHITVAVLKQAGRISGGLGCGG